MVNLATTELLIVLTILAPYFTVKVIYKPLKIKNMKNQANCWNREACNYNCTSSTESTSCC